MTHDAPTTTPLLLIGGGGHCAAVIDVIEQSEQFTVAGIVEAVGCAETEFMGYPIVGTDKDLPGLLKTTPDCVITVGQLKSSELRKQLFKRVQTLGGRLPVIVSPLAQIATQAELGAGTVVMHYALVNSLATVGENCIVNSYALVEHGSKVGPHCHLSTRSTVNGDCQIGSDCLIGSSATLLQGKSVCANVIVGAGALIVCDIEEAGVYFGSPAKQYVSGDSDHV